MDWSKLQWDNGELWWVAVASAGALAIGHVLLFAWRRRVRERLGDPVVVGRLLQTVSVPRQVGKAVLFVLGATLVVLAVLRPQYGMRETEVTHTGIDIAVLLDASQSMLVRDVAPDRFTASKREIAKVMDRLEGGRVTLVPFYFLPFVQAPLTSDFEALKVYLRDLRLQDIADPEMRGTAIGRALAAGVGILTRDERRLREAAGVETESEAAPPREDGDERGYAGSKYKAIVLFTDGEEHESIPEELLQAARDAGIRIFAVGVGTATGNAVPNVQDDGEVTGVLKQDGDQPVFSSVNEQLLQDLAQATGGQYFSFANRSVAAELGAALAALEKKEFESRLEKLGEDRFQFVLFPALLLLGAELAISDRRRRRRENGKGGTP